MYRELLQGNSTSSNEDEIVCRQPRTHPLKPRAKTSTQSPQVTFIATYLLRSPLSSNNLTFLLFFFLSRFHISYILKQDNAKYCRFSCFFLDNFKFLNKYFLNGLTFHGGLIGFVVVTFDGYKSTRRETGYL